MAVVYVAVLKDALKEAPGVDFAVPMEAVKGAIIKLAALSQPLAPPNFAASMVVEPPVKSRGVSSLPRAVPCAWNMVENTSVLWISADARGA